MSARKAATPTLVPVSEGIPSEPAPIVDLIDEINRNWYEVNDLLGLVSAIGEVGADRIGDDENRLDEFIAGMGAIARIVRDKADVMNQNAKKLFEAVGGVK